MTQKTNITRYIYVKLPITLEYDSLGYVYIEEHNRIKNINSILSKIKETETFFKNKSLHSNIKSKPNSYDLGPGYFTSKYLINPYYKEFDVGIIFYLKGHHVLNSIDKDKLKKYEIYKNQLKYGSSREYEYPFNYLTEELYDLCVKSKNNLKIISSYYESLGCLVPPCKYIFKGYDLFYTTMLEGHPCHGIVDYNLDYKEYTTTKDYLIKFNKNKDVFYGLIKKEYYYTDINLSIEHLHVILKKVCYIEEPFKGLSINL